MGGFATTRREGDGLSPLLWLADRGLDPVYGARPLRRFIQREIETPLAKEILAGQILDGSSVKVTLKDAHVAFESKVGGFSD